MGCGSSTTADPNAANEQKANKKIQDEQKRAEEADTEVKKLLLLGAGASGKSTLFKQIKTIYGGGFSEEQRKSYIPVIHLNIVQSIKCLLTECGSVSDDHKTLAAEVSAVPDDEILTVEIGHKVSVLWRDAAVQTAWGRAHEFQINDSAKYFLDSIDRVSAVHYIPTEMDLLHSRVATTGIVEDHFTIEGNKFALFDVGGQRNERKKWIHCFENVTAVIFVTALSEYNQTLFEDSTTNRLVESLNLFSDIINNQFLMKTSMILFLNKKDLFAEKLPRHPLSRYFPEYKGDDTEKDAAKWIQRQFEHKNKNREGRKIYTHVTCAVDKTNVKFVFNSVKDIVIRAVLKKTFDV